MTKGTEMASRREQKESARRARLEAEQAAAARGARTRRLGIVAGVVILALIVVVVAVVVSTSGSKPPGVATGPAETAVANSVARQLRGIPQNGVVLGQASAPVTVQYFGDLECPVCQALTLGEDHGGLPRLIAGPVRQGEVKLVYKSFETATGHVNADRWYPQQVAAYAAGRQNLFWQYAELFYHEQGSEDDPYVSEDYLSGLARQIPSLNVAKWTADRHDAALRSQVAADGELAARDGLGGTPTLVAVGPENKAIIQGNIPTYAQIMTAVRAVSN
jgi:protein-disulfide isomerase